MKFLRKKIKSLIPLKFLIERGVLLSSEKRKLEKLKDKYKGRRCFIIGNGPSLNKIDLEQLNNEFTFGVNGIFYKTKENGFKPTFYVVEDNHVINDNLDEINKIDCEYKFFPSEYRFKIKKNESTFFFNLNRSFYEQKSINYQRPQFSWDCSKKIFGLGSVTLINIQLAVFLGFQDIYLLGIDFEYKIPNTAILEGLDIISQEDDPNHFHPEYFGKGKKWHDPQLHLVEKSFKHVKENIAIKGCNIYNATVGGKLEVFERKPLEEIIGLKK